MSGVLIVRRAILHILDVNSGVTVFSERELDVHSESVISFLTKHLEKSHQDQNAKTGLFLPESPCRRLVEDYLAERTSFIEFSMSMAERLHAAMSEEDEWESADLVVCDVTMDEQRYVALLKCNNRVGFTHQVVQEEDKIKNEIINHYAILPGLSQKLDEYAFIDTSSFAVRFVDKKRLVNGEEAYILPEKVLFCTSNISPQRTMKLVNTIAKKVAENHGESAVAAVTKAKTLMVEHTESSEYLDPVQVGREVFRSSPLMQQEYFEEVQKAGISEAVRIDREFCAKKGRQHKIKTDTGIEISFPVDYFENKEYMEFINNPDGTISIALKNIGKIINR